MNRLSTSLSYRASASMTAPNDSYGRPKRVTGPVTTRSWRSWTRTRSSRKSVAPAALARKVQQVLDLRPAERWYGRLTPPADPAPNVTQPA